MCLINWGLKIPDSFAHLTQVDTEKARQLIMHLGLIEVLEEFRATQGPVFVNNFLIMSLLSSLHT
jgi:hypothetical protein